MNNINRHNYEEFFLLYIDNELPAAARKAVEAFVEQNPDLGRELVMLQQSTLRPEKQLVFTHKELLLKPVAGELNINISNYETFFLLYADNELTNEQNAAVEYFVYQNPQLQETFELLQQIKLTPDTSIVFAGKESLYRKEEDDKVVPFYWWRMAAAAVVLLALGLFWLNRSKSTTSPEIVINGKNDSRPVNPVNTITNKKTDPAVMQPADKTPLPLQENIAAATTANKKANKQPGLKNNTRPGIKKDTGTTDKNNIAEDERFYAQNDPKGKTIDPARNLVSRSSIEIKREPAAGETGIKEPIIDRPALLANNTNQDETASWVQHNDNIEILNTTVDKKNALRGLFRKASRFISKKTNFSNDDGSHKGIVIGGFEIAVK